MFATSSYAVKPWYKEDEQSSYDSSSSYEEEAEESYGEEDYSDETGENEVSDYESESYSDATDGYTDDNYTDEEYSENYLEEESTYVWPSAEETDHMTQIAYKALTEQEALHADLTPDTEYLFDNAATYTENGTFIGITNDDFNSKKMLVDIYSYAMKDVLNGHDSTLIASLLSTRSPFYGEEINRFETMKIMEEGSYNLINLNIDPSLERGWSVNVVQTFEYTNPKGDVSYFETRSTFDFDYDGQYLYVYDILRHHKDE